MHKDVFPHMISLLPTYFVTLQSEHKAFKHGAVVLKRQRYTPKSITLWFYLRNDVYG